MKMIVGVDEAGRGPLAGPVAVGTLAVAEDFDLLAAFPGLNDSKQLTERARERLFAQLEQRALTGDVRYHVELVSAAIIDQEGIVPAVRSGVNSGIRKLLPNAAEGKVFLDGSLKAPIEYEQETLIRGDSLIPAIMLASVAAKVTRDRHMVRLATEYPLYGFEKHKGYGTQLHLAALREHDLCEEHRRSFLRNFLATK